MHFASRVLIALLSVLTDCRARLVNVTIDDYYGDALTGKNVSYSAVAEGSAESWNGGTDKDLFYPVFLRGLDWGKPQNGTLHFTYTDTKISLSIDFEGTAIYVFFVLYSGTTTNLTWFVDDNSTAESYVHEQSTPFGEDSSFYTYNVPVFSKENLDYGRHRAVISTSPDTVSDDSSVEALFDYALYTTDTDVIHQGDDTGSTARPQGTAQTPSSAKHPQHGSAVVIAVCLVCGVLAVAGAGWYLSRRRRLRRAAESATAWNNNGGVPEPYPLGLESPRTGKAFFQALLRTKGPGESAVSEPYPVGDRRAEKAFLWGLFEKPSHRQRAKVHFEKLAIPTATGPEPAVEPGSSTPAANGGSAVAFPAD